MEPTKFGRCPRGCLDGLDSIGDCHPLEKKDGKWVLIKHKGFEDHNTKDGYCPGSGQEPKKGPYCDVVRSNEVKVIFTCNNCNKEGTVTMDKVAAHSDCADKYLTCPNCGTEVTSITY